MLMIKTDQQMHMLLSLPLSMLVTAAYDLLICALDSSSLFLQCPLSFSVIIIMIMMIIAIMMVMMIARQFIGAITRTRAPGWICCDVFSVRLTFQFRSLAVSIVLR